MKIASQNRTPPIAHQWPHCRTTRRWGSGAMARSGKRLVFSRDAFAIALFWDAIGETDC
jgi:hypothetical protein